LGQCRPNRAIAQQKAVFGAGRNRRRSDCDGDRASVLLNTVLGSGNDQEVTVRRADKDVIARSPQLGADAATNGGPALRDVAEQLRIHGRIAHREVNAMSEGTCPGPNSVEKRRKLLQAGGEIILALVEKLQKSAEFCIWHACCFVYCVHLVPQTT
jgi:hypothetical protein